MRPVLEDMRIIEVVPGPARAKFRPLLALADDSPAAVRAALTAGRLFALVAGAAGEVPIGEALTHERGDGVIELASLAIDAAYQGRGLGRALVTEVLRRAQAEGARRALVATAIAGLGALRFYLRLGFRPRSIERDAFTPANGYPPDLVEDGIPILDRIWLDRPLE